MGDALLDKSGKEVLNLSLGRELTAGRIWTDRLGINDKPIEIYYRGQWIATWMSNIQVGDFWQLLQANGNPDLSHCYECMTPVRQVKTRSGELTFSLGVNQIVVAPPRPDPILVLENQERPKLGYAVNSAHDVEYIEYVSKDEPKD